jgi:CO/xanthine dehydrogenase FAD-binding subunit
MLAALSAMLTVRSARGERNLPIAELFSGKGDAPFTLDAGELLTGIQVFPPPPGSGTAYEKLRWRSAIDYPLASAGAMVALSKGKVDRVRLALGAAAPRPLIVEEADRILRGNEPSPELIDRAAAAAQRQAEGTVVDNALPPEDYRRRMMGVMARRALTSAIKRAS